MGKLSAISCETAKPDPKRDRLLGDGDGLFLRIRPHGTKTWVVEYEFQGKRTKYTIGSYTRQSAPGDSISDWLRYGQQTLTQARSIAGCWKASRRAGHDPVAEWEALLSQERQLAEAKQAELEAEAAIPTVKHAVEIFMEKIMAGKKSAPAIRYRLNRLAELIDDKKIRDVSKQEIVAALDKIAEGQRNGKPAKQLTGEILTQAKRLWRFAKSRDWVTFSCLEELTRRDFDAKPTKRDVTLRLDELAVVWKTLDNPEQCKSDPISIAALKLLILTGQRESEVCKSKWTEFDLSNGLWKIPAERTKTKRAHLVHLAPQAIAVLENIHPISGAGDYVFASPIKPGQPIYGRSVNNALVTLFTKGCLSNIARCRVHDFRRTLITKLPDLGFEPFIGHKIANHVLSGVFAHYNHNSYEELRKKALLEWASRLELLVNNSNVLPFQKSVK